jgi:hypothetical protein
MNGHFLSSLAMLSKLAIVLVTLASCGQLSPARVEATGESMTARVHGHPITVRFYSTGAEDFSGFAAMEFGTCTVYIRRVYLESPVFGHVLAHEIGHCLDHYELGWDHNGFTDQGSRFSKYHATPEEGYAESFAEMYTVSCGASFVPLLNDDPCIPKARDVKP